jgi:hypothetical protein
LPEHPRPLIPDPRTPANCQLSPCPHSGTTGPPRYKREDSVKANFSRAVCKTASIRQRRVRAKTLESSRSNHLASGGTPFHKPSMRPNFRPWVFFANIPPPGRCESGKTSFRFPRRILTRRLWHGPFSGCESAQSTPARPNSRRPGAPAGCSRYERLPDAASPPAASSTIALPTYAPPPLWPYISACCGSDANTLSGTEDRDAPPTAPPPPAFQFLFWLPVRMPLLFSTALAGRK